MAAPTGRSYPGTPMRQFRGSDDLWDRVMTYARAHNMTGSEVIRAALDDFLGRAAE